MEQNNKAGAVPEGFIRMSDVFIAAKARAGTVEPAMPWKSVSEVWFPEIPALEWVDTTNVMKEGRLKALELAFESHDGYRYTLLQTLWFDEKPFAIVQEAGRGGRDYRRRIVSDKNVLGEALAYVIRSMVLSVESDRETVERGMDDIIALEEVFDFYSSGLAEKLGYHVAKPRRDLYEFGGDAGEKHLQPILAGGEVLIVAMGVAPAAHLRSGDTYYAYDRMLTDADIGEIPKLDKYRDAIAEKAIKAGKVPTLLVYRKLAARPDNFVEAVPL